MQSGFTIAELRLFQFEQPKAGRARVKTCLTGQCDRSLPIKVGTHEGLRLVPATSHGDKSHCVNWPFLLQNLVPGTQLWSLRLVP